MSARMTAPEDQAAIAGAPPPAAPGWVGYVLVACGLVILVLFAATTNLRQLSLALRGMRPALLVLAAAEVSLNILAKAFRWRYMVRRLTGTAISTRFAALSIVAGVAAGSVVPARSFEMAKALLLKGSHGVNLGLATSAMIVERILDILLWISALLLAAMLLPRGMVLQNGVLLTVVVVFVAGVVLVFAAPRRVQGWLAVLVRSMPAPARVRTRGQALVDALCESILLWRRGRTLGVLLALSAVGTLFDLARVCAVFWAMGAALTVPFLVFTYVGAAMLGMALLIPGGVGVTEVSQVGLITLLAPGAVLSGVVRSAVLVDRFLSYYLLTLIGGALLTAYHRYRHVFR